MIMKCIALILTSIAWLVSSEDCPSGYAPHTGTLPQSQKVQWSSCHVKNSPLQCGELYVPLDYNNHSLGILTLRLVRYPAKSTTAKAKSIFINPGGPGGSGVVHVKNFGATLALQTGGAYHIVSFDPRGVGLTIPYECPNVGVEDELPPRSEPGAIDAAFDYYTKQGFKCGEAAYRSLGQHIGTAYVARDIDALFQALDEDGLIRYWGFSYGTLLGSTLAAMFPEKIDRMVLDSNINPTDYYHGTYEETVHDSDASLLHYFEACADAGPNVCALATSGASGQDIHDEFNTWLYNVRDEKLTYRLEDDPRDWGYVLIRNQLSGALYNPAGWYDAAMLIAYFMQQNSTNGTSRAKRDVSWIDVVTPEYEENYESEAPNILWGVTCGDWDDLDGTFTNYKDWYQLYQRSSKFMGDEMINYLYQCSKWEVNAKEKYKGEFAGIETRNPILFVNGHYDHVTPLISAQNSSSGFVNSKVLQHTVPGHCTGIEYSSCVIKKVMSYWTTGKLPNVDEICEPIFPAGQLFALGATSGKSKRDSLWRRRAPRVEEYPALFRVSDPPAGGDATEHELPTPVKRSSTPTLIPATCTPGSPSGKNPGSGTLSEEELQQGLSDLQDICSTYTGDKWFFRVICISLGYKTEG